MKQILVEIDTDLVKELERVVPAKRRKRSEFIRLAIRKALWDVQERKTQKAYIQIPDSDEPIYFDPNLWETRLPKTKRIKKV